VTSALVSTLIQQWAREYLQYSQPSAAPHKRGRVRAYLFDGLSQFQMRRLTHGVPVLLHLAVFLFFYAISEWLYSINVPVGTTARYCLVTLFAVYMALSVLPLIVRNAPYQTALTTPLQACVSLIRASYIVLRRLVRRSSTAYEAHKRSGLFKSVHVDRARALMREIQKRASELDRSAMRWLLQELDEDDMDTFLSGLPGYLHSPLTDKKVVVEGLIEDGVPGRIREHITTCLRSGELSQEESMSRASTCINSLRLISKTASEAAIRRPSLRGDDIEEIMGYLEPLCYNSSTALRASCIRGLVLREFLIPLVDLDDRNVQTKFPEYLIPLHKVISVWKTTEISQWSHITGILTATSHPLPSDTDSEQVQRDMWQDVYDGPLINLVLLAYAILSRADEGDVNFDMAWKTLGTLLKSLGLAQVRASLPARVRFVEILQKTLDWASEYDGGITQISPLLKTLEIVLRGLRLAEAFAYTPKPVLPRKQIEAIFGPEQLRNTELLEAFASYLPGYVSASTPEESQEFMERLILEDKLWEQLHVNLAKCFNPRVPFPDKLRILMAFFDIFDVAFDVLKESTIVDWRSWDLDVLFGLILEFERRVAPGQSINKVVAFRSVLLRGQFCHALLSQFAMRHSHGEPLMMEFANSLVRLVGLLGLGTPEDLDSWKAGPGVRNAFDMMSKTGAILNVALRDGPLSNFCILGRLPFDSMASVSDLTPDATKKLWKTLERIVDTPAAPFANSSVAAWTRFDHLCALVRDPALSGGNSQTMEILRPLLDMIEKVERIRPPADGRAERTGNVDNQTRPGGRPIPGSSRQVGASHIGRGGPVATLSSPSPGTIPLAGMPQSPPRGRTSHSSPHLDWVTTDGSTGSVERDTAQFGVAPIPGSSRQVEAWGPGVGGAMDPRLARSVQASIRTAGMDPLAFRGWTRRSPSDVDSVAPNAPPTSLIPTTQAGPHVPQMHPLAFTPTYMPSLSGPRRAFSYDGANLPVQAHTQSVLADIPLPPRHMLTHPYPSSSSSPGPLDVRQLGHLYQGDRVPVDWTGGLQTPDPNFRASKYLFLILQYLVAD
jgi:hypothetical protein